MNTKSKKMFRAKCFLMVFISLLLLMTFVLNAKHMETFIGKDFTRTRILPFLNIWNNSTMEPTNSEQPHMTKSTIKFSNSDIFQTRKPTIPDQPGTTKPANSDLPHTIETTDVDQPQTIKSTNLDQPRTTESTNSEQLHTIKSMNSTNLNQPNTTESAKDESNTDIYSNQNTEVHRCIEALLGNNTQQMNNCKKIRNKTIMKTIIDKYNKLTQRKKQQQDFHRDISSEFIHHKVKGSMVPNVVHYIWFGVREFEFFHAVAVYSAYKFLKPEKIVFHGDTIPTGPWWDFVKNKTSHLKFHYTGKPTYVYRKKLEHLEHSADIMRLLILQDEGGIYMDTDVIVLKSFDPLRRYDVTMGKESDDGLANGIILAKKGAPFLRLIFEAYRTYSKKEWSRHSVGVPYDLSKIYPHLIHVEKTSLLRPSWMDAKILFQGHYNWTENYAIHIWHRDYKAIGGYFPHCPEDLYDLDTTLGEVMRYVLFGNSTLLSVNPMNTTNHNSTRHMNVTCQSYDVFNVTKQLVEEGDPINTPERKQKAHTIEKQTGNSFKTQKRVERIEELQTQEISTFKLLQKYIESQKHEIRTDSTLVPTDSTLVPTDSTLVPADGTLVPTDSTLVPIDSTLVSIDSTLVPTDGTLVPT
ncbi:unnamed protein product, partial [Owenia fusiformis]